MEKQNGAITASSRLPSLSAPSTRDTGSGRAATAEPVRYPTDWAINITSLRRDVREFRENTAAYRDSQAFLSFLDPRLPRTGLSSSTDSEYKSTVIDAPRPLRYFSTAEPSSERRLLLPSIGPASAGRSRSLPPTKSQEPPTTQLPKVESSPRAPSFSPITRENTPADHEPHSAEGGNSNTQAFRRATLRLREPSSSLNPTL